MNPDIHVEMYRPERTFGWAVRVWRQNLDGAYQVQRWDNGVIRWDNIEPGVEAGFTYYFDDQVIRQISDLWLETNPQPQPGPAVVSVLQEALADAKQVRDEHMRLVREMLPLAAKPPMLVPARSDT